MATRIKDIADCLEIIAPPALQEEWDNSGLLTGNGETICTGVLVTLDITKPYWRRLLPVDAIWWWRIIRSFLKD